ncbi:MAG: hypothetical protein MJ181_01910 [Treponema sp.]|uniref:hypothetical protein n=1 Tax=Treponema sp. TaxID=166 RepID=UPI00298E9D7F|nr:hypothetical protein [Treponema sp.]MCQ2596578.1 hypothetical protein [Treponema sp.]MCQ2601607.1 hypothetical protein [Treponema sp.]
MAFQKYTKKNIEVQAIQFKGGLEQVQELSDKGLKFVSLNDDNTLIQVKTSVGEINATIGDYILLGMNGEFTVCKENDFPKLYEETTPPKDTQVKNPDSKTIFNFALLSITIVILISAISIFSYSSMNKKNISKIVDICYQEKIEKESKQLLAKAQIEADEIITNAKKNAKEEAEKTFREEMTRITNERIRSSK